MEFPATAQATIVDYLWSFCDLDLSGTYCSTYAEYELNRSAHPEWTWRDYEEVNPRFEQINEDAFIYLYDQHVRWRDIVALNKKWQPKYYRCRSELKTMMARLTTIV